MEWKNPLRDRAKLEREIAINTANKKCERYTKQLVEVAESYRNDQGNDDKRQKLERAINACIKFGIYYKHDPDSFATHAGHLRAEAQALKEEFLPEEGK